MDWTIAKHDGYISTIGTGWVDIIAIDMADLNNLTDYYVADIDVVVLSIKDGVSEGGAARKTFWYCKGWGTPKIAAGDIVKVGTNAVNFITIESSSSPYQYLYIKIAASDTDPTQHQAFVTVKAFEPD